MNPYPLLKISLSTDLLKEAYIKFQIHTQAFINVSPSIPSKSYDPIKTGHEK
jgi:hypothetical protein